MVALNEERIRQLVEAHGSVPYELADRTAPEGNAFAMLAQWRHQAQHAGWPASAVTEVVTLAMSGGYENLRDVLESTTLHVVNRGAW